MHSLIPDLLELWFMVHLVLLVVVVSGSSAASAVDMSSDSPGMSKSEMVKMLKMQQSMLKKLVSAES